MAKKDGEDKAGKWRLSFIPVLKYNIVFCALTLVVILLGGGFLTVNQMSLDARAALTSAHAQVSSRVDGALTLLRSMAALPEYYDPKVEPIEKVRKVDKISPYFGYMMICFVDADITVYTDGSEPASLASRDYMQRLFATGEPQVTDSFAAGADGATLNYTVAVPLKDEQGEITGCLFCAIYFDEVVEILERSAGVSGAEATLIGTQGQIMSSTGGLAYGDPIMEQVRGSLLFGTTADKLQEQFLAQEPGAYWSIRNGGLYYTEYEHVENTGWDIICSVGFWTVFASILPAHLLVAALTLLLCLGLLWLVRRVIATQMETVDTLVGSVEQLEKKIYQDERPDDVDFNEIIRLTSTGLSDSLTGVVTRSVFINQAEAQLKKLDDGRQPALCFVDMDNLKTINDQYGHAGGDIALKSIGYVLREFEKRYDGVAGRYGGDEFVLLLTDLDDREELEKVLSELAGRLHIEVRMGGETVPIQCSLGVSVWEPGMTLSRLISDADEALYSVKQNGKGTYKIY